MTPARTHGAAGMPHRGGAAEGPVVRAVCSPTVTVQTGQSVANALFAVRSCTGAGTDNFAAIHPVSGTSGGGSEPLGRPRDGSDEGVMRPTGL
ncbi:hypothetical protein JOD54_002523 [Actinokineospora baliensis]|nr:hypothetical protein [Actinokineospora baliensis]